MNAPVFHFGSGTEQDRYRAAVSTIIGDIQKATKLDLCLIADSIEVDKKTILNAFNKRSDLGAMYLARLGRKYGASFLNPYFALMGAQAAPLEPDQQPDILPIILDAATQVAKDRDPEGPGGTAEVPQERKARLPKLKAVHRVLSLQIAADEAALA